MRDWICGLAVAPLFLALGCATRLAPPQVDIEEMDELSDELASEGLDIMRRYVARMRAVADPLRLHAGELCAEKDVPYLGVTVEIVSQGLETPLGRIQRQRGIGVNPTVVSVMPGSPADRAGMRRGDVIRSLNGRRVIRFEDFFGRLASLGDGAPRLELERDGERIDATLEYQPACTPPPAYSAEGLLLTRSIRGLIIVTRGLMDFVPNDDELAILIAHEIAHEILGSRDASLETEERADRLSFELAQRAGYELDGAVEVWERLAVERPWMIATDPKEPRRYHGYIAARTPRMPAVIAALEEGR